MNHEWSEKAFRQFIDWFYLLSVEPDSLLVQLGDVFDRASNYGKAINLVTHFFKIASSKFQKIFVLGGNHDYCFRKGEYQYATSYLQNSFDNIECIFDEMVWDIEGVKIGFLPFKKVNNHTLEKYYSECLKEDIYTSDIICGHVALEEAGSFFGGINKTRFKAKKFILGHIHARNGVHKKDYVGSILPFKINEAQTELQRCIQVIDTSDISSWKEIYIPKFIQFETINFGDSIPPTGDNIILYTIKNCKHLQEARAQYPYNYIYNIEKPNKVDNVSISKQNLLLTPEDALSLMIKEQKLILKRKTLQLIKELL